MSEQSSEGGRARAHGGVKEVGAVGGANHKHVLLAAACAQRVPTATMTAPGVSGGCVRRLFPSAAEGFFFFSYPYHVRACEGVHFCQQLRHHPVHHAPAVAAGSPRLCERTESGRTGR